MGDFKIFLFQSSADYDTGFSVSAQCFRKDDPVTPYTSCTWMLVISIQLFIVKLREREGQRVDLGRSLKGHLWMVDGGWWYTFP